MCNELVRCMRFVGVLGGTDVLLCDFEDDLCRPSPSSLPAEEAGVTDSTATLAIMASLR